MRSAYAEARRLKTPLVVLLRQTFLPGTCQQRAWYYQVQVIPVVAVLLWLLIPTVDAPGSTVVQPLLWSCAFHLVYSGTQMYIWLPHHSSSHRPVIAIMFGLFAYFMLFGWPSWGIMLAIFLLGGGIDAGFNYGIFVALPESLNRSLVVPLSLIVAGLPLLLYLLQQWHSHRAAELAISQQPMPLPAPEDSPGVESSVSSGELFHPRHPYGPPPNATSLLVLPKLASGPRQTTHSEAIFWLFSTFCVLLVAYYACQIFTAVAWVRGVPALSPFVGGHDNARVLLSIPFTMMSIAFEVLISFVSKETHFKHPAVNPEHASAMCFVASFGLRLMFQNFERALFTSFDSLSGVIQAEAQRFVQEMLSVPGRCTVWYYSHFIVTRPRFLPRPKERPPPYKEHVLRVLGANAHKKIAEFISLVAWIVPVFVLRNSTNANAFEYGLSDIPPERVMVLLQFVIVFVVFEVAILFITRVLARYINVDVFGSAIQPFASWQARATYMFLAIHVVQDAFIARAAAK